MHYPGMNDRRHYRAAVIGAGFGGVAVGAALGQAGIDYVILERAASIGGTWRDNTYPGCRCDVPSHLYSLSFAPTPEWTRTYSAQPEILAYLRRTADRLGVRTQVRLGHEVLGARWDPAANRWLLDTAHGPFSADVLISANGVLAEPAMPDLPGLADFGGRVFHSARWDPRANLARQRVGVVGTGASAVQIVPAIAPQVASLSVFQRTPAWILPHTDRPITSWERTVYRRVPAAQRAVRTAVYWQRELLASGMAKHPRQMALVRMVAARHLARQVPDPDLRKRLTPQYTPGCKRLVPSNDFYPALLQPHAELITDPIERLTGRGVVTGPAPGRTHELDVLILATGFRVTDNPVMARIQGADGTRLADVWAPAGPKAFLATTVAGFPNLFLINGPNSAIGHTSLLVMTEAQIPYIVGAIKALDEHRIAALDLRADVQDRYNDWLDGKLSRTVWNSGGCDSWYLHAHGRNSVLWPDYTWRFRRLLGRFDVRPYHQLGRSS
jgi:cation diffusion facilitator CzcD-associated flavoprotein CzcO